MRHTRCSLELCSINRRIKHSTRPPRETQSLRNSNTPNCEQFVDSFCIRAVCVPDYVQRFELTYEPAVRSNDRTKTYKVRERSAQEVQEVREELRSAPVTAHIILIQRCVIKLQCSPFGDERMKPATDCEWCRSGTGTGCGKWWAAVKIEIHMQSRRQLCTLRNAGALPVKLTFEAAVCVGCVCVC